MEETENVKVPYLLVSDVENIFFFLLLLYIPALVKSLSHFAHFLIFFFFFAIVFLAFFMHPKPWVSLISQSPSIKVRP